MNTLAIAAALAAQPLTPATAPVRAELIRIADGIDAAVDAKDWPRAQSYFADEVATDFSSLGGGPAARISGQQLVDAWSTNLKASKTSFHARTNHQVVIEGDRATMTSHGYAWNRLEGNGEPLWEVWGLYTHSFERRGDRWLVTGLTLKVTHERGNMWVKATPGR